MLQKCYILMSDSGRLNFNHLLLKNLTWSEVMVRFAMTGAELAGCAKN